MGDVVCVAVLREAIKLFDRRKARGDNRPRLTVRRSLRSLGGGTEPWLSV